MPRVFYQPGLAATMLEVLQVMGAPFPPHPRDRGCRETSDPLLNSTGKGWHLPGLAGTLLEVLLV